VNDDSDRASDQATPAAGSAGAKDATALTRYPGYDVLARWQGPDWDASTREVVRRRVEDVPPIRFLTEPEALLLEAVSARIILQSDRVAQARVPIVPWIDEKLHHDRRDGYRYEEMPPLRETWRIGLAGIDESAELIQADLFASLDPLAQDGVLRSLQRGDAPGQTWTRLSSTRFFRDVLCLTVVKIYYAHPAAWSEIGYSGPSSPRGHVRNWMGGVDPWDAPERSG
jgi:hypothetical protein